MIGLYQQGYMRIFSAISNKITLIVVLVLTSVATQAQDFNRSINWLPELKAISTIDGKIYKQ